MVWPGMLLPVFSQLLAAALAAPCATPLLPAETEAEVMALRTAAEDAGASESQRMELLSDLQAMLAALEDRGVATGAMGGVSHAPAATAAVGIAITTTNAMANFLALGEIHQELEEQSTILGEALKNDNVDLALETSRDFGRVLETVLADTQSAHVPKTRWMNAALTLMEHYDQAVALGVTTHGLTMPRQDTRITPAHVISNLIEVCRDTEALRRVISSTALPLTARQFTALVSKALSEDRLDAFDVLLGLSPAPVHVSSAVAAKAVEHAMDGSGIGPVAALSRVLGPRTLSGAVSHDSVTGLEISAGIRREPSLLHFAAAILENHARNEIRILGLQTVTRPVRISASRFLPLLQVFEAVMMLPGINRTTRDGRGHTALQRAAAVVAKVSPSGDSAELTECENIIERLRVLPLPTRRVR